MLFLAEVYSCGMTAAMQSLIPHASASRLGFCDNDFLGVYEALDGGPTADSGSSLSLWIALNKRAKSHWCIYCQWDHQQWNGSADETLCSCRRHEQCSERQIISSSASSCLNIKTKQFLILRIRWFVFLFLQYCLLGKTNSISHSKDYGNIKKAHLYQLSPAQATLSSAREFTSSDFGEK